MTRRIVTEGLAPSTSLAPSSSLAPQTNVYAGGPITPHTIAMGVGSGGTLTDVSTYVEFGQGVTYTYGRQTGFDDTNPGVFTFTLNNSDGRFTPDNATSPYTTTVAEGMYVKWTLGTRIVIGRVLSVDIPSNEASWNMLVITCDDMLGTAGRHGFSTVADGLLGRSLPGVLWKLDEPSGSQVGVESFGDPLGPFSLYRSNASSTVGGVTFGATQAGGLPGTAVTVAAAAGETNWFGTRHGNTVQNTRITSPYLSTGVGGQGPSIGFYNMWVYPGSTINLAVVPTFGVENAGYAWSAQIRCTPTSYTVKPGDAAGYTYTLTAQEQLAPHYVAMQFSMVWQTSGNYWALYAALWVDGAFKGNASWHDPQHGYQVPAYLNSLSPVEVSVSVTGGSTTLSGTVQRISYTTAAFQSYEFNVLQTTLDSRRMAVDTMGDDINTAVYNGPLSIAPIGFATDSNRTLLDLLNDIARTEAGHLFVNTVNSSGTLYSYIQVRANDRPQAPSTIFDATSDLDGPPSFVRDITNVAASIDVAGPSSKVTVADPTIVGRYVTKGTAETVLYSGVEDLREWGQDRIQRGKNRAVRVQTFSVDAVTTAIDRSADLLAIVPGDRTQLKGLPAARLGFATWDGWVIGGSESHNPDSNRFTYTVTPTLPNPAVYDTDLFAAGGDLRIGNTYTATDTSIVFNADYATPVSTVVPYTILIDSEQLTVTAITGSTWRVTRGANGTTAASHTVGAVVEIIPTAIYAY